MYLSRDAKFSYQTLLKNKQNWNFLQKMFNNELLIRVTNKQLSQRLLNSSLIKIINIESLLVLILMFFNLPQIFFLSPGPHKDLSCKLSPATKKVAYPYLILVDFINLIKKQQIFKYIILNFCILDLRCYAMFSTTSKKVLKLL